MKKQLYFLLFALLAQQASAQTGTYASSGYEAVNFGTIDLATGGGTWATERAATPGYISVAGAGSFTGYSNAANVDGYVKAYNQTAFTFPVGTGTELRSLAISASTGTDTYATAWIAGDPTGALDVTDGAGAAHPVATFSAPLQGVSPLGQWDWQHLAGAEASVAVAVSIPDMTTFASATNLRLVGWNGATWVDLSGAATAASNTVDSQLSGTVPNGITALGIGTIETPLPVELISFTASETDCKVTLAWETTGEINLHHFEVQQSQDAVNFAKLDQVRSSQVEGSGNTYAYSTTQPMGTSYYRLKMVDQDNTFEYSSLQSLTTTCGQPDASISVYPNPLTAEQQLVKVDYTTSYKGNAQLSVINLLGQQIIAQSLQVDGPGTTSFGASTLHSGIYFVRLRDAQGKTISSTQKLIKQ